MNPFKALYYSKNPRQFKPAQNQIQVNQLKTTRQNFLLVALNCFIVISNERSGFKLVQWTTFALSKYAIFGLRN